MAGASLLHTEDEEELKSDIDGGYENKVLILLVVRFVLQRQQGGKQQKAAAVEEQLEVVRQTIILSREAVLERRVMGQYWSLLN